MLKTGDRKASSGRINRLLYKKMGRAINDYGMLSAGDKILIAVSGGLDSLAMLKLFEMRQKAIPVSFDAVACFVDINFIKTNCARLCDFLDTCSFKYVKREIKMEPGSGCFWCSWNKRKVLFETARQHGCNKIALGHNFDDMTETVLLNLFFRGEISSSPPSLSMFSGEITLIRPMCYIEKEEVKEFASYWDLSSKAGRCPYENDNRRNSVREIIKGLEKDCPFVKKNIFRSLRRIKKDYLL
ncbi:MAG: hypothetical protein GF375_06705 [Candidatus Omnitrophica bacterium]|nr:hypothetical protein [Candidatus Omnitrophota bacterium]MBD3269664.1 hypothetical protein [Candidatus Omnitrophota bacterium]